MPQKVRKILDEHTIVRKISKKRIVRDLDTGEMRPLAVAFELRDKPSPEKYLSASWLEPSGHDHASRLEATAKCLRTSTFIAPGEPCGFALGQVGHIKNTCNKYKRNVRILHEPNQKNDWYTAIHQIAPNDLLLMEELASETWSTVVMNTDIVDERTTKKEDSHS